MLKELFHNKVLRVIIIPILLIILEVSDYISKTCWYVFFNFIIAAALLVMTVFFIIKGKLKDKVIGICFLLGCLFLIKDSLEYTMAEKKEVVAEVIKVEDYKIRSKTDYIILRTKEGKSYNVVYDKDFKKIYSSKGSYLNKECLITYKEMRDRNIVLNVTTE